MSLSSRLETFAYKHVFVPRQGKHTFDFIGNLYSKGEKVIDFGSGIGTNSKLFSPGDYIGLEINKSRVAESIRAFPDYNFQAIPLINTENDRLPVKDNSHDIVFISLCLHHIDSKTCKLLFAEFRRILKKGGCILGIEPCIISTSIFSNIIMNVVDRGDYIISEADYTDMYKSESFNIDPINIVRTFGYNLWQYKATISENGNINKDFFTKKTQYRKYTKPINTFLTYGKWVALIFIIFLLLQQSILSYLN